jgi:hypothetical protein
MRWLRALVIGALFWLIIFLEISITMIGLQLSYLPTYIIHYIIMIPLALLCAWLYYKSQDKINGFLLGLFLVAVGIILDIIITVPFFIIPAGGNYATYFSQTFLLIGLLEGIVIVGLYDLIRKRKLSN